MRFVVSFSIRFLQKPVPFPDNDALTFTGSPECRYDRGWCPHTPR